MGTQTSPNKDAGVVGIAAIAREAAAPGELVSIVTDDPNGQGEWAIALEPTQRGQRARVELIGYDWPGVV